MQAALLSVLTGMLFFLAVCSILLRLSMTDAASELAENTRAIKDQTAEVTAALSRPLTFVGPVQCSFPKTETAALEEPLMEQPSRPKGKQRK